MIPGTRCYSCAFYHYQVHTRPRVQRASGVPHALYGRKIHQRLGRTARRDRKRVCLDVIASAAKQSILSLRGEMDCFAALAMTAGALDGFAEPVIGRRFAPTRWLAMTIAFVIVRECLRRQLSFGFLLRSFISR